QLSQGKSPIAKQTEVLRRTTTSRSWVETRERLDPLCKQGEPCLSATSACHSSAEARVLTLAVRGVPGTRPAPDSARVWRHYGRRERTLAKLRTSCWRSGSSQKAGQR